MLEAKLAGEEIKRPEPVAETPVVDLMEALRRSVENVQGRKQAAKPGKTKAASSGSGSRPKAPARKSA
jgi:non-homologous end joining protein Ku